MSTKTYGTPSMGCYLDQANYNNDELSAHIIEIAQTYGWELSADDKATLEAFADADSERSDGPDLDVSEKLDWISEEAIEWLNSQEERPFLYWANEGEVGAFGLWANVDGAREDCGFVSSKRQEYPDDDFRGEWLHVSDHGNATLYTRVDTTDANAVYVEDRARGYKDVEIWSVV